jgi:hypothetical protein
MTELGASRGVVLPRLLHALQAQILKSILCRQFPYSTSHSTGFPECVLWFYLDSYTRFRHRFSKVLSVVSVYSKCTRALTFENVCYALKYVGVRRAANTYTHTHIHTHTHTHTQTHTHTHTHTEVCRSTTHSEQDTPTNTHAHTHTHSLSLSVCLSLSLQYVRVRRQASREHLRTPDQLFCG